MTPPVAHGPAAVALVVVLFHPEDGSLAHVREQVAAGHPVIAVSNAILPAQREELRAMAGVTLVDNSANVGLAKALNQGLERFLATDAAFVLLLDQDSHVTPAMIATLRQRAEDLRARGIIVGCVAPRLVDRKVPEAVVGAAGEPATVATSGSLLTREAVAVVGPMWEELFIDAIDHEWCFRARARGYAVVLDREATLAHNMGDAGVRIGARFRPIHRSAFRHYHIVRNTLWLQRCGYIPLGWRLRELVKLSYRAPVYVMVSSDRGATMGALGRAVRDGWARPRHLPVVPA